MTQGNQQKSRHSSDVDAPYNRHAWTWKALVCPHCHEEFRTKVVCVNAEREIDRLKAEIKRINGYHKQRPGSDTQELMLR